MVMFHCYVSSLEGKTCFSWSTSCGWSLRQPVSSLGPRTPSKARPFYCSSTIGAERGSQLVQCPINITQSGKLITPQENEPTRIFNHLESIPTVSDCCALSKSHGRNSMNLLGFGKFAPCTSESSRVSRYTTSELVRMGSRLGLTIKCGFNPEQ